MDRVRDAIFISAPRRPAQIIYPPLDNTGMFNRPFSFNGRIGRLEMIISYAIYLISLVFGIYVAAFGNSTDRTYIAIVGFALLIGGMCIVDVEVVRTGGDASLDREAVRVISSMPKWIPGKQKGTPVRVKYTVPVNFSLK